jgi:putative phosphoesterase
MRIGILSDTHNQVGRTKVAVARLVDSGAQMLVHCGDITGPGVVAELAALPSYFVFGNCDHQLAELRSAIESIGATCLERGGFIVVGHQTVAVTHGDSDLERNRLLAERPNYLMTGHTHRACDYRRGATRCINPGALHRAATWTFALLDLHSDHLSVLTIINTSMRT